MVTKAINDFNPVKWNAVFTGAISLTYKKWTKSVDNASTLATSKYSKNKFFFHLSRAEPIFQYL